MKSWHRYAITLVGGLVVGLGAAWAITGRGLSDGQIANGPWTTSLGYGTKATDPLTRAAVARAGTIRARRAGLCDRPSPKRGFLRGQIRCLDR